MAVRSKDIEPRIVKAVVGARIPNLPAKYPDRPYVVHIVNNLMTFAFGPGKLKERLVRIMRESNARSELLEPGASRQDDEVFASLLDAVFNQDKKVFKSAKFSSPSFWDPKFLGYDTSDDGLSLGLWASFGEDGRQSIRESLIRLLGTDAPPIGLTNLISTLTHLDQDTSSTGGTAAPTLPTDLEPGTPFGKSMAQILAVGLERGSKLPSSYRIEVLRQFGVLSASFAILASLYDSIDAQLDPIRPTNEIDPDEILGLVIYAGRPPGPLADPLVDLAILSAADALERAYLGIKQTFAHQVRHARDLNPGIEWQDFAVNFATSIASGEVARMIGSALGSSNESQFEEVVESNFPLDHYRLLAKSLGSKAGFVVPRKSGHVRFVLEANLLPAFVHFMGEADMTVEDFVGQINRSLGLVLGISGLTSETLGRLEKLSAGVSDVENCLEENEMQLADRLLQSGLALRFSDGTTVLKGIGR